MNSNAYEIFTAFDFSRFIVSLTVLAIAIFLAKTFKVFSSRFAKAFPDYRLRIEQAMTMVNFVLIVGSIALAVFLLFRSKEAALAIAGSIGLAFAIGAKDVAASILSGFIVMFDRSFRVGDRVRFGDIYGDVVSIGVRSTRIRTLDDSIVTVPNSEFMNSPVTSANAGDLDMQVEVFIYVRPDSDLKIVEKLVREAAVSSRCVYLEKPIQVLFRDEIIGNMLLTRVCLKAYVLEVIYEKKFESEVIERCHQAFKEHKINHPQGGY
ncbi:putative MscS family protein.1 [Thalassocella blandensis]|nr:putative MscS family protein.1 [Thalassocella blandensis]